MAPDKDKINEILSRGREDGSELYTERIGAWDCTACDLVGIRGFVKSCPGCGHNKDGEAEAAEYLPDDALYYTKDDIDELLNNAANPDWICQHCNTCVGDAEPNCIHCGAPKSSDRTEVIEYDADGAPSSAAEAKDRNSEKMTESEDAFRTSFGNNDSDSSNQLVRKLAGAGMAIIGAFIVALSIYWLFFDTHTVNAHVRGFNWHREIRVERYGTVTEEDWSIPSGGRQVSSSREIRSYNKVFSHNETKTRSERYQSGTTTSRYKCGTIKTGKGTYSDQYCTSSTPTYSTRQVSYQEPVYKKVPVYDTKYRYEIEKWQFSRELPRDGIDRAPLWPEFTLGSDEREAGRSESLTITLVDDQGKEYRMPLGEQKWRELDYDNTCVLTLNNMGMIVETKF